MYLTKSARVRPYTPHPPALPALHDASRTVAVTDLFTKARQGRAVAMPPPFQDGDVVSCTKGTEWMRTEGQWAIPDQPNSLNVTDETVTGWWHQRHLPGSKFALVHRLTPDETHLINAPRYTTLTYEYDPNASRESTPHTHGQVTGEWLRAVAARALKLSVFLELPSGIVTLHSPIATGVVYLPS
jgi:hypothetical protein